MVEKKKENETDPVLGRWLRYQHPTLELRVEPSVLLLGQLSANAHGKTVKNVLGTHPLLDSHPCQAFHTGQLARVQGPKAPGFS